ncbi:hypothetical protein UFOVP375_7 [uncultured Caudovirales phage]|uniref:Uncharacterized protein n=1 Tax=uncultured Caudovirales phage TaxID=2100421 RepID=A0A6J7XR18_9CAUD|nr:hypothetical protein UFOVP375_7 [uncultured Caudovirales phage]
MNVFVNYNKRNTFATRMELNGSSLSVYVRKNQVESDQSFDLDQIVAQYSEDHGCVALGVSEKWFAWKETTRVSYLYRMPAGRSFSSEFVIGNAVKDDGTQSGSHNVASPAWVLAQDGHYPLLFILTPYKGCSLSDCTIIWKAIEGQPNAAQFLIDGVSQASVVPVSSIKEYLSSWLPISLSGPDTISAGASAQYAISCEVPSDIYITASCGFINRAVAKSGQSLTIDTRGLQPGEKIEIKLGYKWWPGASKKTVAIQ